jgi:seryl-tRNA synthetase
MVGESGTSCTKQVYHYYKCVSAKKHTGCHMKPIRKAWIEDLVVKQISEFLHDDKLIEDIVHMFMEFQKKENTVMPHLERKLAEVEKAINNMLTAIEQGIINSFTKRRLDELESKHRDIETEIIKEKMKRPQLTAEQVRFGFERMREYDITVLEQRKRLVDTFVNAIFVYNDRIIFTFNYKKDAKTVLFSDLKSSDITNVTRPSKRRM